MRTTGFAIVRRAFDASVLSRAARHLSTLRGVRPDSRETAIVAVAPMDPVAVELATCDDAVRIAAQVLGPLPVCFALSYFHKPASVGLRAAWHQDLGPWSEALGKSSAITLWVAMSDADESSGCLKVVPGSHRGPTYELVPDTSLPSMFRAGIAEGVLDERDAIPLVVRAGDVVVLDPNVIHGSDPNQSARDRTALVIRYRERRAMERPPSGIAPLFS